MRFYTGTATNQYNSAEHSHIIHPRASLQHTLLPLPGNTNLPQFKKTFGLGVHPHGLWAACPQLRQGRTAHQRVVPDGLPCQKVSNAVENK